MKFLICGNPPPPAPPLPFLPQIFATQEYLSLTTQHNSSSPAESKLGNLSISCRQSYCLACRYRRSLEGPKLAELPVELITYIASFLPPYIADVLPFLISCRKIHNALTTDQFIYRHIYRVNYDCSYETSQLGCRERYNYKTQVLKREPLRMLFSMKLLKDTYRFDSQGRLEVNANERFNVWECLQSEVPMLNLCPRKDRRMYREMPYLKRYRHALIKPSAGKEILDIHFRYFVTKEGERWMKARNYWKGITWVSAKAVAMFRMLVEMALEADYDTTYDFLSTISDTNLISPNSPPADPKLSTSHLILNRSRNLSLLHLFFISSNLLTYPPLVSDTSNSQNSNSLISTRRQTTGLQLLLRLLLAPLMITPKSQPWLHLVTHLYRMPEWSVYPWLWSEENYAHSQYVAYNPSLYPLYEEETKGVNLFITGVLLNFWSRKLYSLYSTDRVIIAGQPHPLTIWLSRLSDYIGVNNSKDGDPETGIGKDESFCDGTRKRGERDEQNENGSFPTNWALIMTYLSDEDLGFLRSNGGYRWRSEAETLVDSTAHMLIHIDFKNSFSRAKIGSPVLKVSDIYVSPLNIPVESSRSEQILGLADRNRSNNIPLYTLPPCLMNSNLVKDRLEFYAIRFVKTQEDLQVLTDEWNTTYERFEGVVLPRAGGQNRLVVGRWVELEGMHEKDLPGIVLEKKGRAAGAFCMWGITGEKEIGSELGMEAYPLNTSMSREVVYGNT